MKLKKTVICLSSLFLIATGLAFAGCNTQNTPTVTPENVYGEGVTVGGSNTENEKQFFTIENAEDIHVSKGGDISAYVAKVAAVHGNYVEKVTVDQSKVDLTKSGSYDLTYSYKDVVKTVKVCVYEAPVILDGKAGATVETTYANVYKDIFDGITASVMLGDKIVELDVKLETQGLVRADGSFDISERSRTLTFMAEAPSGEVVRLTRDITITGDMVAPNIESSYTYDVFDDALTISGLDQDTIVNFLTISVDETPLPAIVTLNENSAMIQGQGLYDIFGVGKGHTLRLVTSNGYAEATLNIVDEKPVVLDTADVNAFVMEGKINGQSYVLPAAQPANSRQKAEVDFRLLKGETVIVDKVGTVTFDGIGTYTLEYTARGKTFTFDFECYNELGLQGGVMFTSEKKFDYTLAEGYELLKYTVRESAGIVAYYSVDSDEYGDLDAFYETVAGLNKSKIYQLEVYAQYGTEIFSQTIDFTVGDDRIVEALTGANSLDLGRITTHSYLSLDYVTASLGDRMGAFKWHFSGEKVGQTESLLHYDNATAELMTAGMYVTFDVYCTSELNLSWYDATKVTSFYSTGYKGDYSPEIAYYVDGVRYENLTKMQDIPGGYLGKWVTVELNLTRDFAGEKGSTSFNNKWNGLFVLGNYANLRDYDNYVANMKISSYSFMQDDTENLVFEPRAESDGSADDIWQD